MKVLKATMAIILMYSIGQVLFPVEADRPLAKQVTIETSELSNRWMK